MFRDMAMAMAISLWSLLFPCSTIVLYSTMLCNCNIIAHNHRIILIITLTSFYISTSTSTMQFTIYRYLIEEDIKEAQSKDTRMVEVRTGLCWLCWFIYDSMAILSLHLSISLSLHLSISLCHVPVMVIMSRAPILSSGALESQYRSSSIVSTTSPALN